MQFIPGHGVKGVLFVGASKDIRQKNVQQGEHNETDGKNFNDTVPCPFPFLFRPKKKEKHEGGKDGEKQSVKHRIFAPFVGLDYIASLSHFAGKVKRIARIVRKP
ncbi:MAG: hypothetical protein J6M34_08030 [Clostridia bacterium]|nr:hypothetical protein [Clostridia bacterium]